MLQSKLVFNKKNIYFTLPFLLFLCCKTRVVKLEVQGASYCVSNYFSKKYSEYTNQEIRSIVNNPKLLNRFSEKSIRIAIAYDFWKDLIDYVDLEKEVLTNKNKKLEFLELKETIFQHIQFSQSDLNAMVSEIRCYADRFTEIILEMQESETEIIRKNTIWAIGLGAIGTVLDGASIYNNAVNEIVVITSGLLVAYFSYMAYDPSVVVEFKPKSSILKDLYYNPPVSQSFSAPIWFLISRDYSLDGKMVTIRESMLERWEKNNFFGSNSEREKMIGVFFGKGGLANLQMMINRREMIIILKGILQLTEQDLRSFQAELMYYHKN
jgi:hypothetical protein